MARKNIRKNALSQDMKNSVKQLFGAINRYLTLKIVEINQY